MVIKNVRALGNTVYNLTYQPTTHGSGTPTLYSGSAVCSSCCSGIVAKFCWPLHFSFSISLGGS
jgi:hypothetical protein